MKLATLKNGSRDGRLVIVSNDLTRRIDAPVATLQRALDDWQAVAPALRAIAGQLEQDATLGEPFDQAEAHSPLPRAYGWCDGSPYLSHMVRVRRSRGAEMPASFNDDPLLYQGGSDTCDAGKDLNFEFPRLIAHAAKTRGLSVGTIIGSGTVSNADESFGGSCLQEARVIETIRDGAPSTPFMAFGDRVRIEMRDADGQSVFGVIEQEVQRYAA